MTHDRDSETNRRDLRIQIARRHALEDGAPDDAREVEAARRARRGKRQCPWRDGTIVSLWDDSRVVGHIRILPTGNAVVIVRQSSDPAIPPGSKNEWWDARPWVPGRGPDPLRCHGHGCRVRFRGTRLRGGRELCRKCDGYEFETVHDARTPLTATERSAQQIADDDEFPTPF